MNQPLNPLASQNAIDLFQRGMYFLDIAQSLRDPGLAQWAASILLGVLEWIFYEDWPQLWNETIQGINEAMAIYQ